MSTPVPGAHGSAFSAILGRLAGGPRDQSSENIECFNSFASTCPFAR